MSQGFRNRFPTYDVLDKWDTPSWNDQTRAVVAKRLHEVPPRRFFSEAEWELAAGDLRPADPAAGPAGRPGADRAVHRREAAREPGRRLSLRGHAADSARPGGSACDAIDEEARARWQRGFRELPRQSEGRGAALGAARRHAAAMHGRACRRSGFSRACCCTRWSASITRTRRRGARSALAARPRRAAMSGCRRNRRDPWEAMEESRT